ncbi:MAG: TonB-dependent receptor domain-containing protein, partial [Plesiomonas sp.]
MLRKSRISAAIAFALASAAAIPSVYAEEAQSVAAEEAQGVEKLQKIKVTGSRISRVEVETAQPIQVMSKADIERSGLTSVGDILQRIPAISGQAQSTSVNNGGNGTVTVNLRGLGTQRTLVLVNGRRMVYGGSGANSSVDLNTIPVAIIERVEILKNGASSIYGADAVGGVVNIITKSGFDGVELNAQVGQTSKSDAEVHDVSIVAGGSTDVSNYVFSAGLVEEKEAMAGNRSFSNVDYEHDGEGGKFVGGSSRVPWGFFRTSQGVLTKGPEGSATLRPYDSVADAYNYAPANYLKTPSKRWYTSFFGDRSLGQLGVLGETRFFSEASYLNRQSDYLLAASPLAARTDGLGAISKDNIFNTTGEDIVDWRYWTIEAGGRNREFDSSTSRLVLGFDGQLENSWTWDTAFVYGKTKTTESEQNVFMKDRINNAIGATSADGKQCLDSGGKVIAGCVPWNLFGNGGLSQEAIKSASFTRNDNGSNEQQSLEFNLSGDLLEWQAGTIGFAAGYQVRKESGETNPDALVSLKNATGNAEAPTKGSYDVTSLYGEVIIPLLADKPFVESLEASISSRYDNYSSFGDNIAMGYSITYRPYSDLMLRGTYSDVFRAPTIADLYSGKTQSFDVLTDPTGQDDDAQKPVYYGGNGGLKPEQGYSTSLGAVYSPSYIDNASLTVDLWSVKLDDVIDVVDPQYMLDQCFSSGQFCDKIDRAPDGKILGIDATYDNLSSLETNGIDFNVKYAYDLDFAMLAANWENSYLKKYEVTQPNGETLDYAGTFVSDQIGNYSKWRSTMSLDLFNEKMGGSWSARYIKGVTYTADDVDFNVPSMVYHDLNARYQATSALRLTAGVNNVFDKTPPLILNALSANTDTVTYDVLGRAYYLKANYK